MSKSSNGRQTLSRHAIRYERLALSVLFSELLDTLILLNHQERSEDDVVVLRYVHLLKLAYPDAGISQTTIYTVMYERGPVHNPEGSMVDGQKVELKNGMLFNVTRTDKS